MKKLYISHPNIERTMEEDAEFKQKIVERVSSYLDEMLILLPESPYFPSELSGMSRLVQMLTIMSEADVVYFSHGWETNRECVIQHICAKNYGLITIEA